MPCQRYHEMLSAQLDGELPPDQAEVLTAHLETCATCRRLRQELTTLHNDMALDETAVLPAAVEKRILSVTTGAEAAPWRGYYRVPRSLAWAAVLLLVLLAGNAMFDLARSDIDKMAAPSTHAKEFRIQQVEITDADIVGTTTITRGTGRL